MDELTLTTNGSQLARFAGDLAAAGVRRVNVSLDTLDARAVRGDHPLGQVRQGHGRDRGREDAPGSQVKINAVALKGVNEDEIDRMVAWCGAEGFDLTLIETMPLGEIDGDRTDQYLPLSLVRARLAERWTLTDIPYRTGGPARYVRVAETGGRLGFITPLTHNFCEMLQPGPGDLHRHHVHVPGPGGCGRPAQRRCARRRATSRCARRSATASRASPRATTSSSTGGTAAGGRPAHERDRGLSPSR